MNRTIWPTRQGLWFLCMTVGLGLTAMSTGNNLFYLLEAMVLAFIVVSGILSEQSLRGVRAEPVLPEEIHAGLPVVVGARVRNTKRARPSFSVRLERPGTGERMAYIPRLAAGEERLVTWQVTLPRRGRHRLPGVRIATRFPFGLFVKAARPGLDDEVVVFPRVVPAPAALLRPAVGAGSAPLRRRGRGHDLHDLRPYRAGDDPRLIHWRVSARTGVPTVREFEAEAALDARLILRGDGARDAERREEALAEAAAAVRALLRRGARVALRGPGVEVALGRGSAHGRRLLSALGLYAPAASDAPAARPADGAREIVIDLG
jgi:uncharacterized protein (DUF58 family)